MNARQNIAILLRRLLTAPMAPADLKEMIPSKTQRWRVLNEYLPELGFQVGQVDGLYTFTGGDIFEILQPTPPEPSELNALRIENAELRQELAELRALAERML